MTHIAFSFWFIIYASGSLDLAQGAPPGKPQPPTNVEVIETYSSIEVTWDPPTQGKVKGYKVYYMPEKVAKSNPDPSLWYSIEVWDKEPHASVNGITPGLEYVVAVTTVGRKKQESDFSDIATTAPDLHIANVRVIDISDHSISVAWESPSNSRDARIEYRIMYFPFENHMAMHFAYTNHMAFALDELEPGTTYTIAITPTFQNRSGDIFTGEAYVIQSTTPL